MGAYCGDRLIGYREWREPDKERIGCSVSEKRKSDIFEFLVVSEAAREEGAEEIRSRFTLWANVWRNETRNISNVREVIGHYAYRRIIEMGPAVVPYVLRELERFPDLWFYALRKLTNANPVRQEYAGNVRKMREAWLTWAKKNKKI